MAEYPVNVIQEGTHLRLEPPAPVEVGDGDQVRWIFPDDLPRTQLGFVFFPTRFGPFHSLRSFSNYEILSNGNIGSASPGTGQYDYAAIILEPGRPDPIATGQGAIINRATGVNTAPECYVTYHPDRPPEEALEVTPDRLGLYEGDTATWYLLNLPGGAFANFQFLTDPPPPAPLDAATGPFVAFYACGGSGPVTVRANGTGFLAGIKNEDRLKQYIYHLEVRDAEGRLLASHEPLIDTLGAPPT